MQDPNTGLLEPVPETGPKPGWPVYRVGQRVSFNGWSWEVTGFTDDGGLSLKAVRRLPKVSFAARGKAKAAKRRKR